MRPTVLEISVNNFKYNLKQIQNLAGENVILMPVIKADAYGTYLNHRLDLLENFKIVAVAIPDEGKFLREIGFKNEILVLNQPSALEIDTIVNYSLTVGVANFDFICMLNNAAITAKKVINVHIEIETGMNRTGFFLSDLKNHVDDILNLSNVHVDGLYSHLSSADVNSDYTNSQHSRFVEAKEFLDDKFSLKYVHLSASSGILNFNKFGFNTIRPGMILYGFEVFDNSYKSLDLKPVACLKSKISFIKNLPAGEKIGYSGSFVLTKNTKIATVPIGYADGLDRSLSNCGFVVIKDTLVPIIGKICMDSFMVDVSRLDVSVGDDVYIWDNKNLTLESVAQKANTINYEFLSRISQRVPRVFID
jgi:alanine racemase